MAGKRERERPVARKIVGEEEGFVKDPIGETPLIVLDSSLSESELLRLQLRGRWELASVLNFLHVFKPVFESDLKISAEEIETALIEPNNALSQLHISLLKASLLEFHLWLKGRFHSLQPRGMHEALLILIHYALLLLRLQTPTEAIMTFFRHFSCREEISKYKELDPTIRLLILKALCEIRADQDDMVAYINDALKQGTELSTFRKYRIGEDGNGTTYWYDGDSIIGHRLYRERNKVEFRPRLNGKGRLTQPTRSFQWETLATNLGEFQEISDKFSSSEVIVEAAVGKIVKNEVIPVLEELQKKKERALKRQQRKAMAVDSFLKSFGSGIVRSHRNRRPVSYTFEEYDRSIDEALEITKEPKTIKEQKHEGKHSERGERTGVASNGTLDPDTGLTDNAVQESDPVKNDIDDDKFRRGGGDDDDNNDDDYDGENNDDDIDDSSSNSEKETDNFNHGNRATHHSQKQKVPRANEAVGLRRSQRTAGSTSHPVVETRNHADTKKRLRQRPTRNTAFDLLIISDSESGKLSEDMSNDFSGSEKESSPDGHGSSAEVEKNNDV
ncbi:hypothetical protein HHK36_025680 [Tetracentron sinense]|uniref:DDT domain-containing protein n=1 Tax=Tetracentron sinense TaxID=13715 RepID=A0A834YLQ3_TETSI|nr:hypothetical protein HHK36_025680 [Tetracentron sinense]